MAYRSVWWYPTHFEYGAGLNGAKTFPQVQEQYRRPHALFDLRYYDLPTEEYQEKLYYRLPRLGVPEYRGTFRDKPHTVAPYYPGECPQGKPVGFHGRVYYEDGPAQFKYQGPKKDKLYWLEREPYLPKFRESHDMEQNVYQCRNASTRRDCSGVGRQATTRCNTGAAPSLQCSARVTQPTHTMSASDFAKRTTQDGVGYL